MMLLTVLAAVGVAVLFIGGLMYVSLHLTSKKEAENPEAWKDSGYGSGDGRAYADQDLGGFDGCGGGGD